MENNTMNQEVTNETVEQAVEAVQTVAKNVATVPKKGFMQRHENAVWIGVGAAGTATVAGVVYLTCKYVGPKAKKLVNAAGDALYNFNHRNDEGESVADTTATEKEEEEAKDYEEK